MKQQLFYRNVRAREQLDIFLISAIGSLLLTRFFLAVANYPQIGGNGLHIGHMLFGGLFMLASITISLAFLGLRVQRLSALLGGIGFGIFIDEIGKFITSDNNYFYRPAVGIIYAIFIILYLTFNFLGRKQKLTSREYQLNAMAQLEEAILHDMDPLEKKRAHTLLAHANRRSVITTHLQQLLESIDLVPETQPRMLRRVLAKLDAMYVTFWRKRNTRLLVRIFFIAEAAIFVIAVAANAFINLDDIAQVFSGKVTYGVGLLIGQFVSSLVAAAVIVYGAFYLKKSRLKAFEYFRRATLINLFLTEFFVFSRIEFDALPGFAFNLAILLLITYVIHQEQRTERPSEQTDFIG
ncbi:MAG TPA: hypothetical protein VF575_02325 [Candidatus Saccharimonadales bacterium]|jgi:hypothetical protein